MKQTLKKKLKRAFPAPEPIAKETFFKTIPKPQISNFEFIRLQAGYIPIWVWGISLATFMVALFSAYFMEKDTLWIISACIPFVALSAVTENNKSSVYRMAELEMATRFSLKNVVLARLGIIGTMHLLLIALLCPFVYIDQVAITIHAGVYLLVPYLLTTFLSLACTRKLRGPEATYLCMGIAVTISGLNILSQSKFYIYYEQEYFHWWIILLIILFALTVSGYYKTIQNTEDLTWNLF